MSIDEPTILVSDSHALIKPPYGERGPKQTRLAGDADALGGASLWSER